MLSNHVNVNLVQVGQEYSWTNEERWQALYLYTKRRPSYTPKPRPLGLEAQLSIVKEGRRIPDGVLCDECTRTLDLTK